MVVGRAMEVTHRKCVVFRLTLSDAPAEEGEEQAGFKEVTHLEGRGPVWVSRWGRGDTGFPGVIRWKGLVPTPTLWLRWESSLGLSFPFCVRGRVTDVHLSPGGRVTSIPFLSVMLIFKLSVLMGLHPCAFCLLASAGQGTAV